MIEIETLEFDNKEYMIIKRKKVDNESYVLISNVEDPEDFAIRKEVIKDGEELVIELGSKEEFEKVLPFFIDNK